LEPNEPRNRVIRLLSSSEITDKEERQKLEILVKTKKWNPYCFRHSSISSDSDYLPDFALKKKVRWSMNSRQGARYIKKRMGNELKQKILEYNGIRLSNSKQNGPTVLECARCRLVNAHDNKFCTECAYPLTPLAYEEIKESEDKRIKKMEEKIEFLLDTQKEILECHKYPEKLTQIALEK
jgi:hypothetical protein